jgi:hypothetical protein
MLRLLCRRGSAVGYDNAIQPTVRARLAILSDTQATDFLRAVISRKSPKASLAPTGVKAGRPQVCCNFVWPRELASHQITRTGGQSRRHMILSRQHRQLEGSCGPWTSRFGANVFSLTCGQLHVSATLIVADAKGKVAPARSSACCSTCTLGCARYRGPLGGPFSLDGGIRIDPVRTERLLYLLKFSPKPTI